MPSKLITYTGVMAAPMDLSDAEGGGKGSKGGSALSVSRSSVKINKNMRRAMTQPRPAPQVYKTEPAEFRSLVQRLTGTTPPSESSAKPLNPRLQKIAPPPLRPVFSYPTLQQALPQLSPQQQNQISGFNPGPRRNFLNSMSTMAYQNQLASQRHSNFPVSPLSFSPLPALSPSDHIWANVLNPMESPRTVAMRNLAQSMSMAGGTSSRGDVGSLPPPMQPPQDTNLANLSLPMEFSRFSGPPSPRMSAPFNLPRQDLPTDQFGFGSMYGYSGPLSPTPSSLSMDDTFSFPDPDIPKSRYS
ncbi:hypothetical protein M758_9G055200 [Ceratodon purpureus]|uniref:VQ domain-containing protein n=1 Tax=Ceratodon purpureus TaxID=3225 RepID=A0A8T0GP12_CERPU|nr:hypothetical protein KC19_9G055500 [Ceratodon purpureus]KAG0605390.1 hypothetical protein M758_9G055200 [Ceratodon purpureus]